MRRVLQTGYLALPLLALSLPASAQSLVHFFPFSGRTVADVGDIDLDGVDDLIFTSLVTGATVVSGADGTVLYPAVLGTFGHSMAGCGDLDGDGVPDFVIGDFDKPVAVASGATGSQVWSSAGFPTSYGFGRFVASAGDANGDGRADVLASGEYLRATGEPGPGLVSLLSGADGSVIRRWAGVGPGAGTFGFGLGTLGDLDGDGFAEQAVGDIGEGGGAVHVYSGAEGSTVKVLSPGGLHASFGRTLEGRADLDGDGINDLVVGDPEWNGKTGKVTVFSGADWSVHFSVEGEVAMVSNLGADVDVIDDINGDGHPEVLVSGAHDPSLPWAAGFVHVLSGLDGKILLRVPAVTILGLDSPDSLAALGDVTGDGWPEFAVASHDGVRVLSTTLLAPKIYCSAKLNSQGCPPLTTWTGSPSVTGTDDFVLSGAQFINQSRGVVLWSREPGPGYYQQPSLCVGEPWMVAQAFETGGSSATVDCSGSASFHASHDFLGSAGLSPGDSVFVQFVYRDRLQPDGSFMGLSEGVHFSVLP